MKFDIRIFFLKSADKIQVPLKSDNSNGHFTYKTICICDQISLSLLRTKSAADKSDEILRTHILRSIIFF